MGRIQERTRPGPTETYKMAKASMNCGFNKVTHPTRVLEAEQREDGTEKVLEGITAENFPDFVRYINLQSQEDE